MKTNLFFLMLFFSLGLFAQVPQGFNYQAVVRNDAGEVIKNQEIKVKIGILQGGNTGTLVWEEEHTVTTNNLGLVSLMVGDPDAINTGGSLTSFEDIDWSTGDYYLQVSVDPGDGSGYVQMGEARLLSVPYALYAGKADGVGWSKEGDTLTFPGNIGVGTDKVAGTKLAVQGDDVASDAPLFEVKRKDGQTVFAVYNDSIRMYVNGASSSKGPRRGGFAIGGFGMTKGEPQPLMWISPDSARIYYEQTDKKGPHRGGFAIGGFDMGKKGPSTQLMQLTKLNYFIGHNSGLRTTTGVDNVFLGNHAGYSNQSGSTNVFLGFESGYKNTTGSDNVLLGYNAGHEITSGDNNINIGSNAGYLNNRSSDNIFIGKQAGFNHIYGNESNLYKSNFNIYIGHMAGYGSPDGDSSNLNIFIGNKAGYSIKSGSDNIFIGDGAGYSNVASHWNVYLGLSAGKSCKGAQNVFIGGASGAWADGTNNCYIGAFSGRGLPVPNLNTGYGNTFLGYYSGIGNSSGSNNVFLGMNTGESNGAGNNNVYIGYDAARNNRGYGNIFIGSYAGKNETAANNKLIISNNENKNLIEGDFENDIVTIKDVLTLVPRKSFPARAEEGQLVVNAEDHHIYCYLDGEWRQLDE